MNKKGIAIQATVIMAVVIITTIIAMIFLLKGTSTHSKSTTCQAMGGKCTKPSQCEGEQTFLEGCKNDEICCIEGDNI